MARAGYSFSKDVPPLLPDPILGLTPHFSSLPSLSFAVPGMACTTTTILFASYLSTRTLSTTYPPPRMDVAQMCAFLDNIGLADFPVAIAYYGHLPSQTITVLVHGTRREDGLCICHAPQRVVLPVPGAPPPPPIPPHWAFLKSPVTAKTELLPYVVFSSVFLGTDFYWHADRPSPEYNVMAHNNLACLCKHRCLHEPLRFRTAPSLGWDERADCRLDVEEIFSPMYSHGLNDALVYRSTKRCFMEQPAAIGLGSRADLRDFERLDIVTSNFHLAAYRVPRLGRTWLASTLGALLCAFTSRLLHSYATARFGNNTASTSLGLLRSLFLKPPPPPELVFKLPYFGKVRQSVALPIVLGLGAFFALLRRPKRHLALDAPLAAYRGEFPPTMRSHSTPVGRRLLRVARTRQDWSAVDLRALIRRTIAEHHYRDDIDPYELDEWIRRNAVVQAAAPIPALPVGHCVTCLRRARLRHCQCSNCRAMSKDERLWFYVPPFTLQHVGMRPLFTRAPVIPMDRIEWRTRNPKEFPSFCGVKYQDLYSFYRSLIQFHPSRATARGRLCGPMFMGLQPACFERGDWMSAIAAAARLLVLPPCHHFVDDAAVEPYGFEQEFRRLWDLASALFPSLLVPLEPWTRQMVIDHQHVAIKRLAMLRSYAEMDAGIILEPRELMKVKPFGKAEKDVRDAHDSTFTYLVPKKKAVTRCINPVHPHVIAICAPYSYPMSKLLNRVFNCSANIFYASGSTPDEINIFLNRAVSVFRTVIEDDVSMADGSHSPGSFEFQHQFLKAQWPDMDRYAWSVFMEMTQGRMSTGRFRAYVHHVNLSGVPLTSWTNTIVFIFVRLCALAVAYGYAPHVDQLLPSDLSAMLPLIYMAVAGDDGLTFLPASHRGVGPGDPEFLKTYSMVWASFGFPVPPDKIRVFHPHNWRLSTFLAMRPVWSGDRYEYGVEIARRMKSMFWQLDNNMHPVAWARGICISLLTCSRHVPVVSDICKWYLERTSGAATKTEFTNPYSTFYGYNVLGDLCERGIQEFCADYSLDVSAYYDFRRMLERTGDVLVNLSHPVLEAVFERE
jgi:hypothetical protein